MLKKAFFALGLLMAATLFANPFTVTQTGTDYIKLTFTMPQYTWQKIEHQGVTYNKPDGDFEVVIEEAGKPMVANVVGRVGLPGDAVWQAHILNQQTTVVNNILPYPAPSMELVKKEPVYNFYKHQPTYGSASLYPAKVVEKTPAACAGDVRFAGLRINPIQYNCAKKQAVVTTSIELEIRIVGDTSAKRGWQTASSYLDADPDFLLNPQQARKWRLPRKPSTQNITRTRQDAIAQIQLVVDSDGIYRVTRQDLINAVNEAETDLPLAFSWDSVDPRYFELYDKNGPVPVHFPGDKDRRFNEGDYFEFYGERNHGKTGYMDASTQLNTYTLKLTDHIGTRMAVENGGLQSSSAGSYYPAKIYQQTKHFEQQNSFSRFGYYRQHVPGENLEPHEVWREDIYMWDYISAPDLQSYEIELEYPSESTTQGFTVKVCLVGSTFPTAAQHNQYPNQPDHHAIVRLNNTMVDQQYWFGQDDVILTNGSDNFLPNSALFNGENLLHISLPGDTYKTVENTALDWIEVTYWRDYITDNDVLEFTKPSDRPFGLFQFTLQNFSSNDVSIYKIGSSIMENAQIEAFATSGGAPYNITMQDSVFSNDVRYIALTQAQKKKPVTIKPDIPSNLKNHPYGTQYVIISPSEYVNSEGTIALQQLWAEQGLATEIVDVQDIYDEFNNGMRSADAIKDFIGWAYNNWPQPYLTYVVLLGDGMYDGKDSQDSKLYNKIPFKKVWTWEIGATPSDTYLACVVGDDPVPDVIISRLPVWKEEHIDAIASKSRAFIENPQWDKHWHGRVTMAAGGKASDDYDIFAQQSERIRAQGIPEDFDVDRVYAAVQTVDSGFHGSTFELRNAFNDGSVYIQFMGHGAGQVWADYNLLTYSQVTSLQNTCLPMVVSLSCYSSSFETAGSACIAEALMVNPNGGAIAHVGFTGLAYLAQDEPYAKSLTEGIFTKRFETVGQCFNYAVAKFFSYGYNYSDYALTWGSSLIGDPAAALNIAHKDIQINLSSYCAAVGDTITIDASVPDGYTSVRFKVSGVNEIALNQPYDDIDVPVSEGKATYKYVVDGTGEQSVFSRYVYVSAVSPYGQVTGKTRFNIGSATVADVVLVPEMPTQTDTPLLRARLFDKDGVNKAWVQWREFIGGVSVTQLRELFYDQQNDYWATQEGFTSLAAGTIRTYKIVIKDNNGEEYESEDLYYTVAGADLVVTNMQFLQNNGQPSVRVMVQNLGSVASDETDIILSRQAASTNRAQIAQQQLPQIEPLESMFVVIPFEPLTGADLTLTVEANPERDMPETSYTNNTQKLDGSYNMFYAGQSAMQASSLDNNLEVVFPQNIIGQQTVFGIEQQSGLTPVNQPNTYGVTLADSTAGTGYTITCFDESLLADSLGYFPNQRSVELHFKWKQNPDEPVNGKDYFVYRWEPDYQKWIYQGGLPNTAEQTTVYQASRTGTYGLMRTDDRVVPSIEANVEEQEFTYGGYIAGDGTISFLLSDANGIDVFDNRIMLYLNGEPVSQDEFSQSVQPGGLTHVPVKYQLNLGSGEYTVFISCVDVNGNYFERSINFTVNKTFGITNLANYPNPVISKTIDYNNSGRTRFTYVLTDSADDVYLKVFTVSGRLVKTFRNLPTAVGYHEYPRTIHAWDVRDETGQYLANGVYFYKLCARQGGKIIEKIGKLAISK